MIKPPEPPADILLACLFATFLCLLIVATVMAGIDCYAYFHQQWIQYFAVQ